MLLKKLSWRRRGLTLVELLVAVALSVILIGVMTFVWIQSNEIFTTQLNRIETYQRVRNILDTIERDLANTQLTGDMEFFTDTDGNAFFDDTTANPDVRQPSVWGKPGFRDPGFPQDPLVRLGQPEFAVTGADDELSLNSGAFIRAPTIISPEPYLIDQTDGYLQARAYWRDEIYVRSFITIGDHNRPALIHYRLVQPNAGGRSVLRRRIWFLNAQGQMTQSTDQVDVRAVDVCDLKVSFLFKLSPSFGNAYLYHAAPDPNAGGGYGNQLKDDLLKLDAARGFVSTSKGRADPDSGGPQGPIEPLSSQHIGFDKCIPFVYQGNARVEERALGPVAMRTTSGDGTEDLTSGHDLTTVNDLTQYNNFDFRGVRPGTQVLMYGAADDDPAQATGANRLAGARFPPRLWTIETIPAEGGTGLGDSGAFVSLQFLEKVPFARLRSSWLGAETTLDIADGDFFNKVTAPSKPPAGPKRQITASFNVHYRVGFLPSAFVVRLSVDDRHNQKLIPMERVIRLLQQ
ncbi:MAG: PilW family protein [Planctomycetota bacterium]